MNERRTSHVFALLPRALLYGALWAVAITARESLLLPFDQFDSPQKTMLMLPILVGYVADGVLFAWVTLAFAPRVDGAARLGALVFGATALAVAVHIAAQSIWAYSTDMGATWARQLVPSRPQHALFLGWMLLFHGGLFIAACVFATRAQRHRETLDRARIARQTAGALLDNARLDALRAQLDPALLLRAMAAVQQRYAHDPAGADRLLDALVAFLRAAMPGVRSGASTLAAELDLARAYARLAASIEPRRAPWIVDVEAALPDLPFPPSVLVPLMESLGAPGDPATGGGRLAVERREGAVVLALQAAAGAPARLPPELLYRLQVALRALCGEQHRLDVREADPTRGFRLRLRLDLPPAGPSGAAPADPPAADLLPAALPFVSREARRLFVY